MLWSNSLGALSKLLKYAAFPGNELPSTYTKRCKIYLEKNLKTGTMWMILCYTTSGLVVIYSSYKICPRGESSKKVFLPSGCWPYKGLPPIPTPIHSAFRDFFWCAFDPRYWFYVFVIVNLLLESPILPYYCCYVTKCLDSGIAEPQKATRSIKKRAWKMDFWDPSTNMKCVLSL